ncbi:putative arabinosyltransferase A [Sesamum angolense]|uniref:Arabinosyltransferase A n=1 Tax=Sesamum angolense TaxID=2727404 RepID=A0AAE1WFV8_9LAMI|nr:putative arabinosyltransferase A [Sesamum angolense]
MILVLRSTGRSHYVDFGILPNSKVLGIWENENLEEAHLISSSAGEGVIWNKNTIKCGSDRPILKVFMYDLAPEFHFGLLGWKGDGKSVWPDIRAKSGEKKSTNAILQEKLVKFLIAQEEWKRSAGKDHIIVAHHPNSLSDARMKLWPAMFILSDFGRYPPNIANVEKDVIAPYRHVTRSYVDDTSDFDSRPTLLYFQGSIYRKDPAHTPSSNRLFDAIASHCVPVIISDEIELPYEDILDYSEFCIFVRTSDALKEKFLLNLIRNISKEKWTRMWKRLKEIEHFYEFQYPSLEDDAVQMIWQAISRKVPAARRKTHRDRRFSRMSLPRERALSTKLCFEHSVLLYYGNHYYRGKTAVGALCGVGHSNWPAIGFLRGVGQSCRPAIEYGICSEIGVFTNLLTGLPTPLSTAQKREVVTCAVGDVHRKRSSLESLFCYDKPIPEEIIEKPIGVSMAEKNVEIIPTAQVVKRKELLFAPHVLDQAYMWTLS